MSKKKIADRRKRSVNDVILVVPEGRLMPGTIKAHSKKFDVSVTKPLEELKRDWSFVNQQVVILLDHTESTTSETGFGLDEVSFKLGISGKGHIGFLAGVEAGGEASIELKFKRRT